MPIIKEANNKVSSNMKLSQCHKDIDQVLDLIVIIFDIVENKLFSQYDFEYIKSFIPLWISDSGRTPESTMTKEVFENLKTNCSDELTNRILYWFDLQSPINALQDRIESVKHIIDELYKLIPHYTRYKDADYTSAVRYMDSRSSLIHTYINVIFVHLASSFDLFTKIVYELEHIDSLNFSIYSELKSRKDRILYSPNKIKSSELKKTGLIFSNPPILRKICSFRDYYIHNGSWDYRCAVYGAAVDGIPEDTFVCLPDTDEKGNLIKSGGRNMFYSKGEKINVTLPKLISDVMVMYKDSINELFKLYPIDNNEEKILPENFSDIVKNWYCSYAYNENMDNQEYMCNCLFRKL